MSPCNDVHDATLDSHAGCVVVTRDATGIAPSSALPAHASTAARHGATQGDMT